MEFLYTIIWTFEILVGIVVVLRVSFVLEMYHCLKIKHLILMLLFPVSLLFFLFGFIILTLIKFISESTFLKKINQFLNKDIKINK